MAEQIISKIIDFSFNGTNLGSVPFVFLQEVKKPLSPKMNFGEYKIPRRNGSYIVKDAYQNIEIQVKILISGNNRPNLCRKLIQPWLNVKSKLIFEDEPDKYYLAEIFESIVYKEKEYFDEITITFLCEPFKYNLVNSSGDIITKNAEMITKTASFPMLENETVFVVNGSKEVTVKNLGNVNIKPVIKISGTASLLNIQTQSYACSIADIRNETVYLDTEKMIVYKIVNNRKVSKLNDFTGRFVELERGENTVRFSGSNINVTVDFVFDNAYVI